MLHAVSNFVFVIWRFRKSLSPWAFSSRDEWGQWAFEGTRPIPHLG